MKVVSNVVVEAAKSLLNAQVRSQNYRKSRMLSLKVTRNVSKVIVKVVLEVRAYMIHERIPYVKSKSGALMS